MKKVVLLILFLLLFIPTLIYSEGRSPIKITDPSGNSYQALELQFPIGSITNLGNRRLSFNFSDPNALKVESDTLDTVAGRGASTTQAITISNILTTKKLYESEPPIYKGRKISLVSPYTARSHVYKGITHTHSTNSDGIQDPNTVVLAYREAGFDFVALTDHNFMTPDPNVPGILFLLGAEQNYVVQHHHITTFGITHDNNGDDSQTIIDDVIADGGIVYLSHPNADFPDGANNHWTNDALDMVTRYYGVEIMNGINGYCDGTGTEPDKVDYLLSKRRHIYLFAGDDCHDVTGNAFGVAYNQVFADELTKDAILDGFKSGNFYASSGASITSISVSGQTLSVYTDANSTIDFIGTGGTVEKEVTHSKDSSYTVVGNEVYIRLKLTRDSDGKYAWSNPIWVTQENSEDAGSGMYLSGNSTVANNIRLRWNGPTNEFENTVTGTEMFNYSTGSFYIDNEDPNAPIILRNGGDNTKRLVLKGGLLGLGTDAPEDEIHVLANASTAILRLERNGYPYTNFYSGMIEAGIDATGDKDINFKTNGVSRMFIDGTGPILAHFPLTLNNDNSNDTKLQFLETTNTNVGAEIYNYTTNAFHVENNLHAPLILRVEEDNAKSIYIDPNGLVGIGSTAPSEKLYIYQANKTALLRVQRGANAATDFFSGTTAGGIDTGTKSVQIKNNDLTRIWIDPNGCVGVGTTTDLNDSAALQIDSTRKAFLPPRMTYAQIVAISAPVAGMMAFATDRKKMMVFSDPNWETVTSTSP